MVKSLVLVATRRCTQRCGYCPVAKDALPDMSAAMAGDALHWFTERFGGGRVKLFGGEPLLNPVMVRSVVDEVSASPLLSTVTLCTNGSLLDDAWIDYLEARPKAWLTLSLDGRPEDHRRSRPPGPGHPDAFASLERLVPRLRRFPRLVVTQVVAPGAAASATEGFRYLLGLGFRRLNLLPASYVRWSAAQIDSLRTSFDEIGVVVKAEWRAGRRLYLRNLFSRNMQPTFTSSVVVDSDGGVFPSDCVLARLPGEERESLHCGRVQDDPDVRSLSDRAAAVPGVIARTWPAEVLRSTELADSVLDGLWRDLIRAYVADGRRTRIAGEADAGRHVGKDFLIGSAPLPRPGRNAVPEVWS